jgi:D-lyxose ketol-isomerase
MKRSEINHLLNEGISFLKSKGISLPPQAYWNLEDWYENRKNAAELEKRRLGWDLTDFGSGKFESTGLLCYTLSNGIIGPDGHPIDQTYSNKLLIVAENQVTPLHHHHSKTEDIINLAGGNLQIKLFNVGRKERLDQKTAVKIFRNGIWITCEPGTIIPLNPGERVRLDRHHYHEFWAQPGHGKVLVEEVSSVNDDRIDNIFAEDFGRFPEIIEDEAPQYLLCTELPGTEKFDVLLRKYLKTG